MPYFVRLRRLALFVGKMSMSMWRGGITGRLEMQEKMIFVLCLEESWCCVSVIVMGGVLARSVRACMLLPSRVL